MGAQKAWAAAVVTLVTVPMAMFGVAEMPTPETVGEAMGVVITALAAAAAAGVTAYLKRNTLSNKET